MARRYHDAAALLQQNVQKHLMQINELSSSEDEEPYESSVLDGVLQRYKGGGGDTQLLKRTKNLLEEAISGRTVTCLICIGSIKRIDAIWNCYHCYCFFHLSCIQKWSTDSCALRSEENHGPISVIKATKIEWCCPKCRESYTKQEIPRKYYCFCGKTDDPPFHPWLIPHSCGEICGRLLYSDNSCKHKCLLLCHPGPCPPCPQTVNGVCFCGKETKRVRCSEAAWSCENQCLRSLACLTHKCKNKCHSGDCPPCSHTSIQNCLCGVEKIKRACNDPKWQCQTVCNKALSCGYHKCEKICHSGGCGDCPNSGTQRCPCGSNEKYVKCPDIIETCLGTCGKKYMCGHTCPEKCHRGACPPCQEIIEKKCQCQAHVKLMSCSKEFKCDTKCRGIRSCTKHGCGRKCCNGKCPPCEKICDKPLQCGRHKCSSVCHLGLCYPCPRESKVTCKCKETFVSVPCGREKKTKIPKCKFPCKIKYKCGHTNDNIHSCHFGDCPPCKSVCQKTYEKCSHQCKATCHAFATVVFKQVAKPATPWEVQPPKTKVMALECPPCVEAMMVTCFGLHENNNQPCHLSKLYSCGRPCGKPLSCGNHECSLPCHLLQPNSQYSHVPHSCETCNRACSIPRPQKCSHRCSKKACHLGPCPPCEIIEKISCHCGATQIYIKCKSLDSTTAEMLNCKQQCPRKLECGHRCKSTCHSTPCDQGQICFKKTKVYCSCGNIKREVSCNEAQKSKIIVQCDQSCADIKLLAEIEKEKENQKLKEIEEEKNRKELAEYEWKLSGKKKKYKERKASVNKSDASLFKKYGVAIISITMVTLAAMLYVFIIE